MSFNESTRNRQLVSFVLVSYNQKGSIRAAVEGALAQTYEPLEVILSDDASTDGTFQIMQEVASAYCGPHKIVVRQSPSNRGLIGHLNDVVREVAGEIIVLAAGDDVSYAWRTEVLASVFHSHPNAMAVSSDFRPFNHGPSPSSVTPAVAPDAARSFVVERVPAVACIMEGGGAHVGATFAYRRKCFAWPALMSEALLAEDRVLPLRGALLGHAYHVREPLLQYYVAQAQDERAAKKRRNLRAGRAHHWRNMVATIEKACQQGYIGSPTRTLLLLAVSVARRRKAVRRGESKRLDAWSFAAHHVVLRPMRKFGSRRHSTHHQAGSASGK